jgi:hypothetical protein
MIQPADFTPAWWLPGAHLQTLVPNLIPRRGPSLRRERLELPDGDFLDLDWGPECDGPLVLLLHGLEGSSRSPYAAGLMRRLAQTGFQGLVMHFRGWGGSPRQTTVESTRYRRSGKLISPAGCCEKRGLTGQRQRTIKRFFPWIGHRYGRSNSYASLVRFDSGIGN